MRPTSRRLAAGLLALPLLLTAACGDDDEGTGTGEGSGTSSPSAPAPSATVTADNGVVVAGGFGEKPQLTIPEEEPPTELQQEVLSEGDGAAVESGDLVVADYLGQRWTPQEGEEDVFDNSFDAGRPFATSVGQGQVIQGWDQGLVGTTVGSRVLLTVPPELAYGTDEAASELAGETLVFVIDVRGSFSPDETATGTPVEAPEGFPDVASQPGEVPSITSTEGVEPGSEPRSALLVEGEGEPIDPEGTVVMQVLAQPLAGGEPQSTFGQALQQIPAAQLLQVADAFEGANVGSRAVIVAPTQQQTAAPGETAAPSGGGDAVVVDVIGQY